LPWVRVTLKCLKPKETDFTPERLGEHLRKRRLNLGLSQAQAAAQIGFSSNTVLNWEKGHNEPLVEAIPRIVQFLGYDPIPAPVTLSERMRAKRRRMGWTISEAADALGVDETTWGDWERTGIVPWKRYKAMLDRFLEGAEN
jgi:transcriptional regulator with XRE-family HTH domain